MRLGGPFPGEDQWQESTGISKEEKYEQKASKFDSAGMVSYSWNMQWEGGEVMGGEAGKAGRCQSQGV